MSTTDDGTQVSLSDEFAALTDIYDAANDWLDADALHTAVPAVSDWTPAQHVYHFARTNASMLKAAQVLTLGRADAETPALKPAGERILEDGTIPRGVAEAPEVVRPPDDLDDAMLRDTVDRSRQTFDDVLALDAAKIADAEGGLTHPLWGTLTAPQWVRAARIHAEHHLAILDDIATTDGDTAVSRT